MIYTAKPRYFEELAYLFSHSEPSFDHLFPTPIHGRYYAYPLGGSGCFVYPHPGAKRVLFILPGGGYGSLSTLAEGLPFAQQAFLAGDATVVVGYRYGKEAAYPNVLDDLAMAVSLVYQKRVLGEEVLPYTLLGFSAGGHLAGVFASEAEGYSRYHLPSPSALALAYPVVSLLPPTNQETAMASPASRVSPSKRRRSIR